jgi:hypothetical protein
MTFIEFRDKYKELIRTLLIFILMGYAVYLVTDIRTNLVYEVDYEQSNISNINNDNTYEFDSDLVLQEYNDQPQLSLQPQNYKGEYIYYTLDRNSDIVWNLINLSFALFVLGLLWRKEYTCEE